MNESSNQSEGFESTYAMIMRSEEKQRSRFETLVYVTLVASTLFAVSQFGQAAMTSPIGLSRNSTPAAAMAQHGA